MKLLLLTTGGTIESAFDGETIGLMKKGAPSAIDDCFSRFPELTILKKEVTRILSETIRKEDFEAIANALLKVEKEEFDGVILTCGSDTLGYLSSFVGLLMGKRKIPVALVASGSVMTEEGANGKANLLAALTLMKNGAKGVFVPYRNSDRRMLIHDATDLMQANVHDDFFSFSGDERLFDETEKNVVIRPRHTIPSGVFSKEAPLLMKHQVALVTPYPMLDYCRLDFENCAAVLHGLYHSGTLDSEKAVVLFEKLGETPLYLAPLRRGKKRYETTARMLSLGAKAIEEMSLECALMKLILAVNQEKMSVDAFLEED